MNEPKILIIDLGSQYTLVIGRTLRELGCRSAILSPGKAAAWLAENRPKGIILSGGPASVNDVNAPSPPAQILNMNVPILGLCYGMQWLARAAGGEVVSDVSEKHYGSAEVIFDEDPLFAGIDPCQVVWMSHGDSVMPGKNGSRYYSIGRAQKNEALMALRFQDAPWWGVQFHPEVVETPCGKQILGNFLGLCQAEQDWKPANIIYDIRNLAEADYGGVRVVGGFSGGVDSTTLFAILALVLKSRLRAICIDGGQLRQGEIEEIVSHAEVCGASLKIVEAQERFLQALAGIVDAEAKRAAFRRIYKKILEEEARDFGAEAILQGSLATDFIESGQSHGSAGIKTHHNCGLNFCVRELHPFRHLFKYEVRALAHELGLPDSVTERQPFPGPGLFIRINGGPVTPERLEVVRWADAEITKILREDGVWPEISQLVVALNCVPTVGVKGDARVYASSIVVRAVRTSDFMTATGFQIPSETRRRITRTISRHPNIVRVLYDETDKPPATTEME